MTRGFEKISFEQFVKDVGGKREAYGAYELPGRGSGKAAGYDFYLLSDLELEPGEVKKVPTGVKAFFGDDEMLLLVVRSGTGFKNNVRMVNQVGVIDADYYGNEDNEGHIWFKFQNHGEETVVFSRGTAVAQGIFMKYLAAGGDVVLASERRGKY